MRPWSKWIWTAAATDIAIDMHSTVLFYFFLSSHTRDLNFCFYNEPPTSINELINIFSTCSEECWRNLTPIFGSSQLPCGMKTVPKVVLIRQLIQIIFCPKRSEAAALETVRAINERLTTEEMLLLQADAPVMFVRLSCVGLSSNVTMEIALGLVWFRSKVLFLSDLLLGVRCSFLETHADPVILGLYLQGRSRGNRLPITLWSASQTRRLSCRHLLRAALFQTQLLLSHNNLIEEFFLFLSLPLYSLLFSIPLSLMLTP